MNHVLLVEKSVINLLRYCRFILEMISLMSISRVIKKQLEVILEGKNSRLVLMNVEVF
jgi:hypothetical protein